LGLRSANGLARHYKKPVKTKTPLAPFPSRQRVLEKFKLAGAVGKKEAEFLNAELKN
jgi:hypothetical protein